MLSENFKTGRAPRRLRPGPRLLCITTSLSLELWIVGIDKCQ